MNTSRPINGWLAIHKPLGITSAGVVGRIKRYLPKGTKIGHGGTLDPLATGILPVAIGEATKTAGYAMDCRKEYHFTVTFGETRSTDDMEGEVTARTDVIPTREALEAIIPQFTGAISQIPPAYSAIKQDGKRAYDMARAGQEVVLAARQVQIDRLTLLEYDADKHQARFSSVCGKGTYIRSLGRDMARAAGSLGYISTLHRARVGKFCENNAITLEKLEEIVHSTPLEQVLLPVDMVLDDILVVAVSPEESQKIRFGQVLSSSRFQGEPRLVQLMLDGKLVALAEAGYEEIKAVRVFNLI